MLGVFFALLKERFTSVLPFLEKWGGVIVGCTLLAIGALGIIESRAAAAEARAEEQATASGDPHAHHESDDEAAIRKIAARDGSNAGKSEGRIALATFATGILYGLQPDALFVVIPALALPTKAAAFAYCLMFVIGTVVAMGGYTLCLGTASEELCRDRPWMRQNLSTAASCVAIVVGGAVLAAGFGVNVPLLSA